MCEKVGHLRPQPAAFEEGRATENGERESDLSRARKLERANKLNPPRSLVTLVTQL